jgi:hypothetical protein
LPELNKEMVQYNNKNKIDRIKEEY